MALGSQKVLYEQKLEKLALLKLQAESRVEAKIKEAQALEEAKIKEAQALRDTISALTSERERFRTMAAHNKECHHKLNAYYEELKTQHSFKLKALREANDQIAQFRDRVDELLQEKANDMAADGLKNLQELKTSQASYERKYHGLLNLVERRDQLWEERQQKEEARRR